MATQQVVSISGTVSFAINTEFIAGPFVSPPLVPGDIEVIRVSDGVAKVSFPAGYFKGTPSVVATQVWNGRFQGVIGNTCDNAVIDTVDKDSVTINVGNFVGPRGGVQEDRDFSFIVTGYWDIPQSTK